ncbi:hypothetical protein [[Mycoplasma] anseris]|uniref:Phage major capsid protein n=1 Tax=[Mycoplasma] anseris TaxID=92400 RepID=A0A2Z4NDV0_9BACT|nr:hypothetical protein [[Mycoplasma] anseris]AWX69697.1 hypothetical protein DP065_03000 [[Mycoplasma] anseris]
MNELSKQLWLQSYTNADGSTKKDIKLDDIARAKILGQTVNKNVFLELCKGNEITTANELTVWFSKAQSGALKRKSELGTGKFDKWTQGEKIAVEWETPFTSAEAIEAAALMNQDLPLLASKKMEYFIDQFNKTFERESFKMVEKAALPSNKKTLDFEKLSGLEIYTTLVKEATELTLTKDKSEGIDLVAADKVVILVSPEILDKIATSGIIGNRALLSFDGGASTVTHIGGYKIISNPYLNETKAIIATEFSCIGGLRFIAASAGKIDNLSEDQGVYFEATYANGIAYKSLIKTFSQKAIL